MAQPTEKEIIRRAFELWQKAGCPEGRDMEFCRQAERELRSKEKADPNNSSTDKR
jgi:hypothetical protein